MGNFGQRAPRHQSRWFQNIAILGFCVFGHREGFGKLEAIASLDANQITNCQFFSKTYPFFVAWFSKNSINKFLNQEFYGQLPKKAWSKCLFDFPKSCPLGHQDFQKISKRKKVFIKKNWLLTMITNYFEIPVIQNLETFSFFFALGFILFLEVSAKFMMTKISETQVPSFHAYADIKQCFHISKVHENIHDQKDK